ncbi:Selenoprotein T, partial [Ophiophagus hannah]
MKTTLVLLLLVAVGLNGAGAQPGGLPPGKKLRMAYATGPLLKFQIWRVFEEYMRVISQRYPDIRIEGENYLPQPIYRHIASFLSVFKLVLIGFIIVYACMMVFFLSNMIENQCMSTGAFEITLNDVPVWSKLESGHLPSMQQLVQILDNEMKLNVHMEQMPHHRS